MSISSKKLNSLLAIIFCCYWLFSFLKIFIPDGNLKNAIDNNFYAFILTPRVYKMYTSPPKSTTKTIYTFYKNDEAKLKVQADTLLKNRLKNSFGTLEFRKYMKWYLQYFSVNEIALTNAIYKYYWNRDIERANSDSLKYFLNKNDNYKRYIANIVAFSHIMTDISDDDSKDFDKVKVELFRYPAIITMDPANHRKTAYIIKDSLIFNETLHLK